MSKNPTLRTRGLALTNPHIRRAYIWLCVKGTRVYTNWSSNIKSNSWNSFLFRMTITWRERERAYHNWQWGNEWPKCSRCIERVQLVEILQNGKHESEHTRAQITDPLPKCRGWCLHDRSDASQDWGGRHLLYYRSLPKRGGCALDQ